MEDWERVALSEKCRILEEQIATVQKNLASVLAELEQTKQMLILKAENELASLPGHKP